MDFTRFGLRQRPFPATPDTHCYYPATGHEDALDRLRAGLEDAEGVLVLTGVTGTGKTLLCHRLMEQIRERVRCVFLTNGHLRDRAALLQAILFDLQLPYEGKSEQELRLTLIDHLLAEFSASRSLVLIVDEAHHLSPDLLEELRLLGNLEAHSRKAIQVVLVGQPGLLATLKEPSLTALRQRIVVWAALDGLGIDEAADYLRHHLRIAGGSPTQLLDDEAVEILARQTQGSPRLLNQAAHQAFCLADEIDAKAVDAEAALGALELLGLEFAEGNDDEESSADAAAEEKKVLAPSAKVLFANGPRPVYPA